MERIKDTITYIAGLFGITLTFANFYPFIVFILTSSFILFQIIHKIKETKMVDKAMKNEELQNEILKIELEKKRKEIE